VRRGDEEVAKEKKLQTVVDCLKKLDGGEDRSARKSSRIGQIRHLSLHDRPCRYASRQEERERGATRQLNASTSESLAQLARPFAKKDTSIIDRSRSRLISEQTPNDSSNSKDPVASSPLFVDPNEKQERASVSRSLVSEEKDEGG